MTPPAVLELRAFVPAQDFTLAKQFYTDLGFTMTFGGDDIAGFQIGAFSFLLQPPAMQPWGLRVLYLSDPTGVLWHIADRKLA